MRVGIKDSVGAVCKALDETQSVDGEAGRR